MFMLKERQAFWMAFGVAILVLFRTSFAAEPAPAKTDEPVTEEGAEEVDVNKIKKKYWARGDESKLGVVQNRLYTKEGKYHLGVFGGITATDPFLSVKSAGMTFGYNFSEYFALSGVFWKDYVSDSSAMTAFRQEKDAMANTNNPEYFYGLEGTWSLLYGKLSFVSQKIIYYDLHLTFGQGLYNTETGNYYTPYAGIGQRFYVSKSTSLRLDYRLLYRRERLMEKEIPEKLGELGQPRNNFTNSITLGFDFLFN